VTNPSPAEIRDQMVVSMARLLGNGDRVFHGVASPMPMVATLLAKATHAPDLVYLSIAGGVDAAPDELPVSTVDPRLIQGARSMVTLTDLFDLAASGRLDVAFLSGVQIDGQGRINMSAIGSFARPKVRLPGGAGSAAILPRAKRTILWRTRHDRRVFVEQLDFVTASGNVSHVVTPLCIFARSENGLEVVSRHPWASVEAIREGTAFAVQIDESTPVTQIPAAEELAALRKIDQNDVTLTEF
jgi:glutaconate CoA-transferase subunit B